jgi:hypothetical protein
MNMNGQNGRHRQQKPPTKATLERVFPKPSPDELEGLFGFSLYDDLLHCGINSAKAFHMDVARVFLKHGYSVRFEGPCRYQGKNGPVDGYIDLLVKEKDSGFSCAIELDRYVPRTKSVKKLTAVDSARGVVICRSPLCVWLIK